MSYAIQFRSFTSLFSTVVSSRLAVLLVAASGCFGAVACGGGSPAEDNVSSCSDLCACAAAQGADQDTCMSACKQAAVAYTDPAAVCNTELSNAHLDMCSNHCSAFENPAPGDKIGDCKNTGALSVGQSVTCDLGNELNINYLALSVGCNDGETGQFEIEFDSGEKVQMSGDCGTAINVGPLQSKSITVHMLSGGRDDGTISFGDDGSVGLLVGYK